MALDRKEANLKMLNEASDLQSKTKESVFRIQKQVAETEDLGTQTIEQLRRQGQQMDEINTEIEGVGAKLDHSEQLMTTFDFWAFNWFGGKKRQAHKDAAAQIEEANKAEHSRVRELFENQKYDGLASKWRPAGMSLVNNPSISAPEIFDPNSTAPDSRWAIDYALAKIDAEGWTYAGDFNFLNKNGVGEESAKWNCYVRRRKWKYSEGKGSGGATDAIRERQDARVAKNRADKTGTQADKVGYVPRNRGAAPTASGLTSSAMNRGGKKDDQDLDPESAAGLAKIKAQDSEINDGLDNISRALDKIGNIAGSINDETKAQNKKLEKMEGSMQNTMEKQTVVNARLKQIKDHA